MNGLERIQDIITRNVLSRDETADMQGWYLRNAAAFQAESRLLFPACPQCQGKDEVYSKYSNRADDPATWTPTMEELIKAGLGCYRCGT